MRHANLKLIGRLLLSTLLLAVAVIANAQDKIEIDKQEIGSWFERNWMWVAAGVLFIVLLAALGRGSRNRGGVRKTTTVIKDTDGKAKKIITTQENI